MGSVSSCQKQEAQDELERELADKLKNEELQRQLDEQRAKELAFEQKEIDLKEAVPELDGQAKDTGLQEVVEEDDENPDDVSEMSIDSDIIPKEDIPIPIPPCCPHAVDEQLEGILEFETNKLQEKTFEDLKVERHECKELQEGGNMAYVCEQFMCVICDNLSVPVYTIGKDGVKPESVRVPECENCERMACYVCWRKHILEGDRKCPNCQNQIKISDKELEILRSQAKDLPDYSDDENSILDIDDYMVFCTKRALKNILYNLRIIHRCPDKEKWALAEAEKLWNEYFDELMETSGKKAEIEKTLSKINASARTSPALRSQSGALESLAEQAEGGNEGTIDKDSDQMEGGSENDELSVRSKQRSEQASEIAENQRVGSPLQYANQQITVQTQSNLMPSKLENTIADRKIATPMTQPAKADHRVEQGKFEVFEDEEDYFNYNFDDRDLSSKMSNKQALPQPKVAPSEKNDAVELSQLHADIEQISRDKRSLKSTFKSQAPSLKNAGAVIDDSEMPSEVYMSVMNDEDDVKSKTESFLNKSGPIPSDDESETLAEKKKKRKNMHSAVSTFLQNMVQNELKHKRHNFVNADDEDEIMELATQEMTMFETKQVRQAKRALRPKTQLTAMPTHLMTTQMETMPASTQKDQLDLDDLDKEVDDILSTKQQARASSPDQSMIEEKEDEDTLVEEVEHNEKKKKMIRKIADTLYQTTFTYLDYLNHMMTECSDSTKVDGGCPLPKCFAKETMSINNLRLHLVNECNKIMMNCNVCDEKFKRPWIEHHSCVRVYRARVADRDHKIEELYRLLALKDEQIHTLNTEKGHEMERKLQHERIRQTLTMRIKGPQAESEQESMIQSRMPNNSEFRTVQGADQKLVNDEEFPDYINSMGNADSTFYEENDFEPNFRAERMAMAKGTINSFKQTNKFGQDTQDKFQDVNRVTAQSIGVGPSEIDKHSVAIGRSSHYTQMSNAAGPTEHSHHDAAAGESRQRFDVASMGAGRSDSQFNQSVGVGMTEGKYVDHSQGARTAIEFKSQGGQYTRHEQSAGVQMTQASKHSVAMGVSVHNHNVGQQMTDSASNHSIGIDPRTFNGVSGGNQMSAQPSMVSANVGLSSKNQYSQGQQMSAAPSVHSRAFGPSEDNRASAGQQMTHKSIHSKGVGSRVDQASQGNQMTELSMHSANVGQSKGYMRSNYNQMEPMGVVSKGVGSQVEQVSAGNQFTNKSLHSANVGQSQNQMQSQAQQMSHRKNPSKGVGSGIDQNSAGNQVSQLNSMHSANVGASMPQNRSNGQQMSPGRNFEIGSPSNVGQKKALNASKIPSSQQGSRFTNAGINALSAAPSAAPGQRSPNRLQAPNSSLPRSGSLRPQSNDARREVKLQAPPPKRQITIEEANKLKQNVLTVKAVETQIGTTEPYVAHVLQKYKAFNFNLKVFMDDDQISEAKMEENYPVKNGQFKDNVFWGMHIQSDNGKFTPHGFCLFLDRKNKIMHVGSFKYGKEHGQQRVVQSYPAKSRYFSQFTSVQGLLHGPALIERADGRVEIGNYVKSKQDGMWRYRYVDGKVETELFNQGKVTTKAAQNYSGSRQGSRASQRQANAKSHSIAVQ